jgi:hypothetical protein
VKPLLIKAAILLVALAVSAAAVHLAHDSGTLVPPPDAVVEQFVRSLATGRYGSARKQLTDPLRAQVDENGLRALTEALEDRHGPIREVQGARQEVAGTQARAGARVTFASRQEGWLPFTLEQSSGLWRITDLAGLQPR